MAWTTPRDWTNGETVTEAMMDTHVKDNLNALRDGQRVVMVARSAAQSLSAAAFTEITWDTERRDDWAGFVASSAAVSAPTNGIYLVSLTVKFSGGTGAGDSQIQVQQWRGGVPILEITLQSSLYLNCSLTGSMTFEMLTSDQVRAAAYHNYGGTAPTATGYMSIHQMVNTT